MQTVLKRWARRGPESDVGDVQERIRRKYIDETRQRVAVAFIHKLRDIGKTVCWTR